MANGVRGDFYANKMSIRDMVKLQISVDKSKKAVPSGTKFQSFRDLGTATPIATVLQSDIAKHEGYYKSNEQSIMSRIRAQDYLLSNISDIARRFKTELVKYNCPNTEANRDAFLITFKSLTTQLQSELNTKVNDKSLLAGTATDSAAVNLSKVENGIAAGSYDTPNYSYYLGNNNVAASFIQEGEEFESQLFANDPALEKLVRSLKIVTEETISSGDERVIKAQEILDESILGISGLIATVGSKMKVVEVVNEDHQTKRLYKEEKLRELLSTPAEEAIFGMLNEMQRLAGFNKLYSKSLGGELSLLTYL